MKRMAGSSAILLAWAAAAVAQPAPVPPPGLESHAPAAVLAEGASRINQLLSILDKQTDNVVVKIDGEPITDGEVADELRTYPISVGYQPINAIYQFVVENVMRQRAMAIKAKQAGLDKDPAAQRRVQAATNRALALEYVRHEIEPTLTDDALKARYNQEVAGKPGPLEAKVRVILLPTRDEALEAIARLKFTQDFGALAKEISKDGSALSDGDIGWVTADMIDPAIAAVAFSINPGETAPNPVRGAAGWYVIRNEGARQAAAPSFDAVKERLKREMVAEKSLAIRNGIAATITAPKDQIPTIDLDKDKKK
jgi:peptidyl-prolyl cis-trans isomerase C